MGEPVPAAIEELIGNLCSQVEKAEDRAVHWMTQVRDLRIRASQAEAANAVLVDALRPFAKIAEDTSSFWDDNRAAYSLNYEALKVRDLRRAVALVKAADAVAANPAESGAADNCAGEASQSALSAHDEPLLPLPEGGFGLSVSVADSGISPAAPARTETPGQAGKSEP